MRCILDNANYNKDSSISVKKALSVIDTSNIQFAVYGDEIFNLIIEAVGKAKKQVLIQTFVWDKRTKVVHDLRQTLEKIGREKLCTNDVPLDIFILIDEPGLLAQMLYSRSLPRRWPHAPKDLGLGDLPERIRVHVGVYHHNGLNAAHSKTVVIDDEILIITGANFQSSNYGPNCNYDAAILLNGSPAQSAIYDFISIWELRSNAEEENISPDCFINSNDHHEIPSPNSATILCVTSKPRTNYISAFWGPLPPDPVNSAFLTAIDNAKKIIRIATPNLNEPSIVKKLIEYINQRNGNIELLIGFGFNDDREKWYGGTNQQTVRTLFNQIHPEKMYQIHIRWYSRDGIKPGIVHMKFMSIDDVLLIFGSANLDKISLRHCHETNLIIDNANLTRKAIEIIFSPAWEKSIIVHPEHEGILSVHCTI